MSENYLPLGAIKTKLDTPETCENCGTSIVQLDTVALNIRLWVDASTTRANDTFYKKKTHKIHKCKKAPPKVEREKAFREKASAYTRKR